MRHDTTQGFSGVIADGQTAPANALETILAEADHWHATAEGEHRLTVRFT
ncbi:MAG: hypothetical protein GVY22_02685 [Gammaproteobacteria bacterium]|jgi:hypothetical protein|nr:hypothetical protein [Gammaproteobacteria bacterium]